MCRPPALTSRWPLCAGEDSAKLRQQYSLLDATPNTLGMHTPSLHQFGVSPCFATSPLGAPDTLLFTPSSRQQLKSMAAEPIAKFPFEMPSGLTPQFTPPHPAAARLSLIHI